MIWPTAGVVAAPPAPAGQHGPPRFFRMQRWFVHPVIRTDMHQIQVRKLFGKILKRYPKTQYNNNLLKYNNQMNI